MNALVIGGGGFIGRHIVRKLRERGDRVRVLGRRAYLDLAAQGVECCCADIGDAEALIAACGGMDAVFHIAAKVGIWGPRQDYYQTNVIGTKNVIAACCRTGVKRLVYTSTPSVVYSDQAIEGGDESLTYASRFLCHYAATKAEAEQDVLAANQPGVLHTCALRPHLVWGPGDTNLLPRLLARSRSGRLYRIGEGRNLISISYVENIADAHIAACDRLGDDSAAVAGKAYFVNDPEPVNAWDFINLMLRSCGCPVPRRSLPFWLAYAIAACCEAIYATAGWQQEPLLTRFLVLQLATSHWFNCERAQREIGWHPAISQEEGLKRLAAELSARPGELPPV